MLWLALAAALLQEPAPELRFHHFHVRVPDQAAAMADAAERLAASAVILQGHGPGVRRNRRYLVFEESTFDQTVSAGAVQRAPEDSYASAIEWVRARGLSVVFEEFKKLEIGHGLGGNRVTTVAFSSAAPARAVEHLRARGVDPFERRFDIARYRIAPELVVEIAPETDMPDTHWCPMHPGVRSGGPGVCALCKMPLVPLPEPRVGEFSLDVALDPVGDRRGVFGLKLLVREPGTGQVVSSFLEVHERQFHLFIISRDLVWFAHVHPEQRQAGEFVLEQALQPGEYMLIGDFLPAGGTPQTVHRAVVTPGYSGGLFAPPATLQPSAPEQTIEGLRVTLDAKRIEARRAAALRFVVTDAATGARVRDLEPYLGASGHLLIVNAELTTAIHAHPEGSVPGAAELVFEPVLPEPGLVKMWLQFQRQGKVITVPFVIEVAPV